MEWAYDSSPEQKCKGLRELGIAQIQLNQTVFDSRVSKLRVPTPFPKIWIRVLSDMPARATTIVLTFISGIARVMTFGNDRLYWQVSHLLGEMISNICLSAGLLQLVVLIAFRIWIIGVLVASYGLEGAITSLIFPGIVDIYWFGLLFFDPNFDWKPMLFSSIMVSLALYILEFLKPVSIYISPGRYGSSTTE